MDKRCLLGLLFVLMAGSGFAIHREVKPITGTWLNLAYQDVRNKYTNPKGFDNTDPYMWEVKVRELSEMGMEYLVFMAVANEEKSFYPSTLMEWAYPANRKSPVDAIMDAAAKYGMKVFMSTGWAKNQDDNLRIPAIKQRQMDMMEELAGLYKEHPALYGWYLPVEDCLGPVLTDYAVDAVNALTNRARQLTPAKKILISPYGIFNSEFDNPKYAEQLSRLKVDIIAYQDEVGCVRERFPLPRLRENWYHLRAIHDKTGIAMWANCETFTWEKGTNDRSSALIPAAYPRLLAQQVAASMAGVETIISFMYCGIIESPQSSVALGQPVWSNKVYEDYMDWRSGTRYWKLMEAAFRGTIQNGFVRNECPYASLFDNQLAEENSSDVHWVKFPAGYHEVVVKWDKQEQLDELFIRTLNYRKEEIIAPLKVYLYVSDDGVSYRLKRVADVAPYLNNRHDAWVDGLLFDRLDESNIRMFKIAFVAEGNVYMDELFVNPTLENG